MFLHIPLAYPKTLLFPEGIFLNRFGWPLRRRWRKNWYFRSRRPSISPLGIRFEHVVPEVISYNSAIYGVSIGGLVRKLRERQVEGYQKKRKKKKKKVPTPGLEPNFFWDLIERCWWWGPSIWFVGSAWVPIRCWYHLERCWCHGCSCKSSVGRQSFDLCSTQSRKWFLLFWILAESILTSG